MAKLKEHAKLSWCAVGSSLGILWGLYLLIMALLAIGGSNWFWFQADFVPLLAKMYPGYAATVGGAVLGLIWGLICGFVCGFLFVIIHNHILSKCPYKCCK